MRETKFRAYHKERKEMFEIASIDFEEKKAALSNGIIKLLNVDSKQFELLQYTGLKDKNGKEIYEGDIYHVGDKNIRYLAVWFDSGFEGKQLRSTSYTGLKSWAKDIEILGNIYENPELLEENK